MFGFLAKLEDLSTAINSMVAEITKISKQISDVLVDVDEELGDDFDRLVVTKVKLEDGTVYESDNLSVAGENSLTYIYAGDTVIAVTDMRFVAVPK